MAKQMIEYQPESAFIVADDRIVIANLEGAPVVWTTPWSKTINGNPTQYYVVKAFCIVKKNKSSSIIRGCEEEIVEEILCEYPKECRMDVERILRSINLEKCTLLRVHSNIRDLPIEKLFKMVVL
ncbi:hypothetical protein SAMN05216391_11761 [Lachnospiraceae bacterium KHCPX20]|nr:hypothetical protein SAMN05216391_11761 [Lachnospiraceae bacterium KHCPX20]